MSTGPPKAAWTSSCKALRTGWPPAGLQVLTIKPGFVDTPMTAAFPKGPLWASPDAVARDIVRAISAAAAYSTPLGSGAGSCWRFASHRPPLFHRTRL